MDTINQNRLASLFVGAGVAIALLVANIALTFRNTQELSRDSFWVAHSHEVVAHLEAVLSLGKDAETGQRGFIVTGDPRYLEPYNTAIGAIHKQVEVVKQLTSDNPVQQARFSKLNQLIDVRLKELDRIIKLRNDEGLEAARNGMLSDRGKSAMDALRTFVGEMTAHEHALLQDRLIRSEQTYRIAVLTGLLSGIAALAAIGAFLLLLRRHLQIRERAAKVIAEQGERWRTTLASIGDAVIATDRQGIVTNINAVAESLTGWKNDDATGRPLTEVFRIENETTRQPVENPAIRALTEGVIVGLANHTILIAKDSTERAIDDSAAPIRCKDGEIVGCVLVFRDVSERRQADEVLARNERELADFFDNATVGLHWVGPDGIILRANQADLDLVGYPQEEYIGRHIADFYVDSDVIGDILRRLRAGENLQEYPARLRCKDGLIKDVLIDSSARWEDGHFIHTRCFTRDVTDRKRAEELLLRSEQRLRFVMDSMPQKIFTTRTTGEVDYLNPAWTEFSGLSLEQISDWRWTQMVHPDDVAENVRVWKQSVEASEPFSFEQRFRRADGEYRWHISRAKPLKDAEDKVVMWVGSNTDIHEQKQTANKLRQLAADLSEADHRKNEFLAMLAHELRNPLAPIRNALQIVRLADGNGEAAQSASAIMERQVDQLVRLVDDLLDVSRISRGKIDLRRERVDLVSVINQAVETCRPAIECAKHKLSVALPPQPVYLLADPLRLAQVFSNLLNNACKYSEPEGRISLTALRQGSDVIVSVKDTGVGIPPEMLPKIFEMFTQVDRSLERSQGGLGIGLTLVDRLVDLHGGSITAQSEGPGKGSEFVVRLPIIVEKPVALAPEPSGSQPPFTTARRILVVDDNRDSASSLAMLLKMAGNDTQTAYDGLAAVEATATFRPEVVLLDIGLPKLNGYEAARKIREQPWGKDVVLVALTGWGQDEDRQKSQEAGFDAHMVKPVDHAALAKLLAQLLPATD